VLDDTSSASSGRAAHSLLEAPDTLLSVSRFRAAFRTVCAAVGVAVLCAACAAGQHAATAGEKPTLDGTQGQIGKIQLEGVAFRSPSGTSYAPGSTVPLAAYIVNNGQTADKLVKVSSTDFPGGWDVVSTPSALAGPSGAASVGPATGTTNGAPQEIGSGLAVGFGLQNLSPSGAGSPESLVLLGFKGPDPLFPGMSVKVTFTFADAGETTLTVPVELTNAPNGQTVPEQSGAPAE
jgi:copper(I)-binding protein